MQKTQEYRNILEKPLDLLRNRAECVHLGPFDGVVGAFARVNGEDFYITTNTTYIPAIPSLELPHRLFLRSNMRYGTDDPALWPQSWSRFYCHFPAIARKGSRPELDVMWWDPSPDDFIFGNAITRGVGRLSFRELGRFLPLINDIVARCRALQSESRVPISPLFGQLMNMLLMRLEQLQLLDFTYPKMVFALTSLQRAYLELDALYRYLTIYKPRIDNYMISPDRDSHVADCVGAFTADVEVAQALFTARLPFWLLRPAHLFTTANILALVDLREPDFGVFDEPVEGGPPVIYSGNSVDEKIAEIRKAAAHTRWYSNPWRQARTLPRTLLLLFPAAAPATAPTRLLIIILTKAIASSPVSQTSPKKQDMDHKKTAANPPGRRKPAVNPPKPQRDKYRLLDIPEMPPAIPAWRDALANVDRTIQLQLREEHYVLPEPALLVNTSAERRRMLLHHWEMLSPGFLFVLTERAQVLSSQEWRDVLEGLLTTHGPPGSKTHKRSKELERHLRPALAASGMESVEGMPVPRESLHDFTLEKTHEMVWIVAETNFRFELCALDKRAARRERLEEAQACFAGHMLIGAPLSLSKCGLASTNLEERHRYILRIANLMLDWTTRSPRPEIIKRGITQQASWSQADMQTLELAVCRYYTQAFHEYFGRAAVVPMRLGHELPPPS
ncbi:hypothetical protein C8R43DRAFT_902405 [Mycena crocata]|nr:hypothetical protein C8R43DRAFT_902405 [Mycena crocata]